MGLRKSGQGSEKFITSAAPQLRQEFDKRLEGCRFCPQFPFLLFDYWCVVKISLKHYSVVCYLVLLQNRVGSLLNIVEVTVIENDNS